jgi:hypothetical protein
MNIPTLPSENPTERIQNESTNQYQTPIDRPLTTQDFSQEESMIEKYPSHTTEPDTMTLNSDDSLGETLSEPKTTSISIRMSETILQDMWIGMEGKVNRY